MSVTHEPERRVTVVSPAVEDRGEVVALCVDYCAGGQDWDDWGPVCARCGRPVLRDEVCCGWCRRAAAAGRFPATTLDPRTRPGHVTGSPARTTTAPARARRRERPAAGGVCREVGGDTVCDLAGDQEPAVEARLGFDGRLTLSRPDLLDVGLHLDRQQQAQLFLLLRRAVGGDEPERGAA